jgi:hypothetical protein
MIVFMGVPSKIPYSGFSVLFSTGTTTVNNDPRTRPATSDNEKQCLACLFVCPRPFFLGCGAPEGDKI